VADSIISGDPFGAVHGTSPYQETTPQDVAKFHSRDDSDTGIQAHHHTIGIRRNQAAAGNHNHDGSSGKKLGEGLALTVSGSRSSGAALASLISQLKLIMELTDNTTP